MSVLVDTNILVRLSQAGHPHQADCQRALTRLLQQRAEHLMHRPECCVPSRRADREVVRRGRPGQAVSIQITRRAQSQTGLLSGLRPQEDAARDDLSHLVGVDRAQ